MNITTNVKWPIPAKTFLVGEYSAIIGGAGIVLTTQPCFTMTLTTRTDLEAIHPDSPAAKFWLAQNYQYGLVWHDPYEGLGGMGASSAQFLAAYLAHTYIRNIKPCQQNMLENYYQYAWNGQGIRPSGYDVLAQAQRQCVYINQQENQLSPYTWCFPNLAFLLVHTGRKLATHQYLQQAQLSEDFMALSAIAEQTRHAFQRIDEQLLIDSVNAYYQKLLVMQLVNKHSYDLIEMLKNQFQPLAIKGCGAMGADVLLMIGLVGQIDTVEVELRKKGYRILAREKDLFVT